MQRYIVSLTILHISLIHLPQIDADDVITRDEQIYVLIGAHAKCERTIKAQIALVKGWFAAFSIQKSKQGRAHVGLVNLLSGRYVSHNNC